MVGQEEDSQPRSLDANHCLPLFVSQTPTSSVTSSWQRWRFAAMPKGTRKRRHKHISTAWQLLTSRDRQSRSRTFTTPPSWCHNLLVLCFFCLAQHLLASHVIERFHSVLEAFFYFIFLVIYYCYYLFELYVMLGFCLQIAKFIWCLFTFVTATDAARRGRGSDGDASCSPQLKRPEF